MTGTLKVPNADTEDMDDITISAEVTPAAGRASDEAKAISLVQKSMKEPIQEVLVAYYEELKNK